ncbi:hypothetical protein BKA64DRAFT_24897 [Cadophora sp. MPI-SDFR-AT-0126]|nr:hypothetical protein BKA64DRAFT_24897 [Leotiomycetes sp. MPI-SDFR-AT-0126]
MLGKMAFYHQIMLSLRHHAIQIMDCVRGCINSNFLELVPTIGKLVLRSFVIQTALVFAIVITFLVIAVFRLKSVRKPHVTSKSIQQLWSFLPRYVQSFHRYFWVLGSCFFTLGILIRLLAFTAFAISVPMDFAACSILTLLAFIVSLRLAYNTSLDVNVTQHATTQTIESAAPGPKSTLSRKLRHRS